MTCGRKATHSFWVRLPSRAVKREPSQSVEGVWSRAVGGGARAARSCAVLMRPAGPAMATREDDAAGYLGDRGGCLGIRLHVQAMICRPVTSIEFSFTVADVADARVVIEGLIDRRAPSRPRQRRNLSV